jgi:nicotinic acetylcholine receptor, invertebrate
LPASEVFTPDIVLFNNADTRIENQRDALVVIYSDGEMMWVPTSIFRSTCSIDIKYFPFDQQNCSMVFGNLKSKI